MIIKTMCHQLKAHAPAPVPNLPATDPIGGGIKKKLGTPLSISLASLAGLVSITTSN